jgi:tetratricopeptide (TPR) repeat protein
MDDRYDAAVDRAVIAALGEEPRWREEREQVALCLSALRASPQDLLTWEEAEALRGWPKVEALLQLSFEARYNDPNEMWRLAFLAKTAAESLRPEQYGHKLVADIRARAWAELGNAFRIKDQLSDAEDALQRANNLLEQGTGDLLLLARIADLEASLRRAQRRLPEACELLEGVYQLYRQLGDLHLAGRALVSKGINIHHTENPQEAVHLFKKGLELLDPRRDRRLINSTRLSLLYAMVDCGKFKEAGRLLLESGLRLAFSQEPLIFLKFRWIEGMVLAGLKKLRRAELAFEEARAGFQLRGQEYDAALVGLQLATVWLQQGKAQQVRELAQETLETFRDLGIEWEAVRALDMLHQACRQERATVGLIQHVTRFLTRLQQVPQLRFEMP